MNSLHIQLKRDQKNHEGTAEAIAKSDEPRREWLYFCVLSMRWFRLQQDANSSRLGQFSKVCFCTLTGSSEGEQRRPIKDHLGLIWASKSSFSRRELASLSIRSDSYQDFAFDCTLQWALQGFLADKSSSSDSNKGTLRGKIPATQEMITGRIEYITSRAQQVVFVQAIFLFMDN